MEQWADVSGILIPGAQSLFLELKEKIVPPKDY